MLIQKNNILIQGSIPLTNSYKDINQYINPSPISNTDNHINQKLINEKLIPFLKGISQNIKLIPSKLNNNEITNLNCLIKNKYSTKSWSHLKSIKKR